MQVLVLVSQKATNLRLCHYVNDEKIAKRSRPVGTCRQRAKQSVSTKKGSTRTPTGTPTEAAKTAKNSTPRSTRLTREDVASFLDFDTDPLTPSTSSKETRATSKESSVHHLIFRILNLAIPQSQ